MSGFRSARRSASEERWFETVGTERSVAGSWWCFSPARPVASQSLPVAAHGPCPLPPALGRSALPGGSSARSGRSVPGCPAIAGNRQRLHRRRPVGQACKLAQQAGADEAAADYQQSLDTLEQIYQIEQKNRREEQNAREREAADRAREQQLAEIERQRAERERNTTTNRQQSVQSRPSQTIVLQTPIGGQTEIQTSDPDSFLAALEEAGLRSI